MAAIMVMIVILIEIFVIFYLLFTIALSLFVFCDKKKYELFQKEKEKYYDF